MRLLQSDKSPAATRNLQLDFFRGVALLVIFINHMPGNPWSYYTPSRLGPSDAAELFVFLSGFAAALAYGRVFQQAGILPGTARILYRCAQIYAAHLCLFLLMVTILAAAISLGVTHNRWQMDNLLYFFDQTQPALLALVSLKFVPNFIDILPMYLLIMLWIPVMWMMARLNAALAVAFSIALYLAAWQFGWELSADPTSNKSWYFNPFCWQLVFFSGFAFSSGWLPVPRFHKGLFGICIVFALFCYPFGSDLYTYFPVLTVVHDICAPLLDKSHLGLIRFLHFLSLTYLTCYITSQRPHWLQTGISRTIVAMGRQSLPVFILGSGLSFIGGMLLDETAPNSINSAWINLAGIVCMILWAQLLNWLEQKPWKNSLKTLSPAPLNNWTHQAATAIALLGLSLLPLLWLQPPSTPIDMAKNTTAKLPANQQEDPALNTEDTAMQTPGDRPEAAHTL